VDSGPVAPLNPELIQYQLTTMREADWEKEEKTQSGSRETATLFYSALTERKSSYRAPGIALAPFPSSLCQDRDLVQVWVAFGVIVVLLSNCNFIRRLVVHFGG
jgi:hypothetical protein